jgi:hypothetical protein
VTAITASGAELCFPRYVDPVLSQPPVADHEGSFAMAASEHTAFSRESRQTRIPSRDRSRLDRATSLATKVDLVTAQYSAGARDEIAELISILAAKPRQLPLIQNRRA